MAQMPRKAMSPASVSQREAEEERGQVDQAHRVDGVDRMLAVRGQPVEVLGAVVDGVEAPEKGTRCCRRWPQ